MFETLTWEDVYTYTLRLSEKIVNSRFKPNLIVGIARGGWIPARILSDVLYTSSMANVRVEFYTDIGKTAEEPVITQPISENPKSLNVLLVDDIVDSGRSIKKVYDNIKTLGAKEIRIAVLHFKNTAKITPDYWVKRTDAWVIYPWEYRETIISLYQQYKENLSRHEIRNKIIDETRITPPIVDYFMDKL